MFGLRLWSEGLRTADLQNRSALPRLVFVNILFRQHALLGFLIVGELLVESLDFRLHIGSF